MTQQTKAEIIRHFRKAYERASKAEKTRILNTIVESTGYSRKHAIALLCAPAKHKHKLVRSRPSRYAHLYDSLVRIWAAANFICGKRLKPFMPELIRSLKRHKEIKLTRDEQALLLTMSASTIDRLLAPARKQITIKGCPPKPEQIVAALHKAGIAANPVLFEKRNELPALFMKAYEGRPEFDESFFRVQG